MKSLALMALALLATASPALAHPGGHGPRAGMTSRATLAIYVGGADGRQVAASGTCTLVIHPRGGSPRVVTAELVPGDGSEKAGGTLDHGGQVIVQGDRSVELVLLPEPKSGQGAPGGMSPAEEGAPTGPASFRASLAGVNFGLGGLAFEATVILRSGDETTKVPGFAYPF